MKLGDIRVTIFNETGKEISTQIYDLSKAKGTKHWDGLWKWALHQGYTLNVKPERTTNEQRKPPTKLIRDTDDYLGWP